MQVAAFDLTRQNQQLREPLEQAFQRVMASGNFILGDEVKNFESELADYLQIKHAIAVANGSDALVLALMALGVGPGDEVIVPAFTFFATAGSVSRLGATPVFVDVLPETFNIDPVAVRSRITAKTKAIIPVHLFGMAADLDELQAIAGEHKIALIEDAAQSLGAIYHGKPAGAIGDLGCLSFFPTKNLGCFGDGGMVVTNSDDLAGKLRMLRVHGASRKYYHELLGFNSRLDALQAALLRVKLTHLPDWLNRRREIAARYRQNLAGLTGIRLSVETEGHSYNQFTISCDKRDGLRGFLAGQGIGTTIYYPLALHQQPVFQQLGYKQGDLPVSEALTGQVLSLPVFPELTSEEQDYVIAKIREFAGGNA